MSSKKKPVSLAEKISSLVTAAPTSFGSEDECEDTKAKLVDYDDEIDDFNNEFNSSTIRKRNVNLLEEIDKRYMGKKVSRKEIFNNGSSGESDLDGTDIDAQDSIEDKSEFEDEESLNDDIEEQESGEDESEEENDNIEFSQDDEDDDEDDVDEDDKDDSDVDDDFDDSIDISNPLRRDRKPEKDITTMNSTNIRDEIEKGNCVREQLKLWENLLEMRIKLQKCLINSNKMPQYDVYKDFELNNDFKDNCKEVKHKLNGLLNNLLELQTNLINNFPDTKGILTKGKKRKADAEESETNEEDFMDEQISSDTEDEMNDNNEEDNEEEKSNASDSEKKKILPARKRIKLSEFENIIAKNHKAYVDYRNSIIQKWNDKTRIASGVIKKGINQPAVKQIEFALANKNKLVKKTQLKRSEYDIIGKTSTSLEENDGRRIQEYDSEIYDDDDFYHQLLRELIEYKSADITDPIQLSKQWIQLQNMRSKMKRKIDTRATKGRRIRYNVHQKLVNFMAPITQFDTWTDHAKNELYNSLFGKIKSSKEETKPT